MSGIRVNVSKEGISWYRGLYKVPKPQTCWLCQFARFLLQTGADGSRVLLPYRGDTPLFSGATLDHWAGLTTTENDRISVKFSKYVPFKGIKDV